MGNEVHSGLEGVIVAETQLSHVDGEKGRLIIRGYDVEQLSGHLPFEDVCALLWSGAKPGGDAGRAVRSALGRGRAEAFQRLPALRHALQAQDGMDALRGSMAQLPPLDDARITAAMAVYAAAWVRIRQNKAPLAPDPSLSHAADYLRMMSGTAPASPLVEAADTYLVTVSDHGMNASTFTARVIASTGSDRVSTVVGAIGALKGPLHGGAPGPVLEMLDAIGRPERAREWIEAELDAGRRIMGMGHRIYRVRDPRAAVLERAIERLEKSGVATGKLALTRAVERAAEEALAKRHPDRPLKANVEFYTAVVLDAVGIPRKAFTPTFAASRVAGWLAHDAEQRATGRLIRPRSKYIGPMPQG